MKKNSKKKMIEEEKETEIVQKEENSSMEHEEDISIEKKRKIEKNNSSKFLIFLIIILSLCSLFLFGIIIVQKNLGISQIISIVLITLFVLFYIIQCFHRNNKVSIVFSLLLMISFLAFNSYSLLFQKSPVSIQKVPSFYGKKIDTVLKWANKNHINIIQDYEYSDMIPEYYVISQDILEDTDIQKVENLSIAISEGPNPNKEVIIPNMNLWDVDRVIRFVQDNYLSDVEVDFVSSDSPENTVIGQSITGNMKRSDHLLITFTYGEVFPYQEIKLIDFTNKNKFEVELFMKQHQLRYELVYDFSDKIKKGYVSNQSIPAGEVIKVQDERIKITLSKGVKIVIPNLKKMKSSEIIDWSIKNRLRLLFLDSYDDTVKNGEVLSVSHEENQVVEEGEVIKITLSKGSLKMPKLKNLDEFYSWANKYNIKYREEREFNSSVPVGEVIQYSKKTGDVIKNGEEILVTISDGDQVTVPNVKGSSQSDAISKLKNAKLNYNFVYVDSDLEKNMVVSQSIRSGSQVSSGTTITVTLSNGKGKNSSSSNKNEGSSKVEQKEPEKEPDPPAQPEEVKPVCNSCTIPKSLISSTLQGNNTCRDAVNSLRNDIESRCPGIKTDIQCVKKDGYDSLDFIDGFRGGSTDTCQTIRILVAE